MKWGMFEQHALIVTFPSKSHFLMVPHLYNKHHSVVSHCIHDPSLSRLSALINIQYQYKGVLILILNTPSVLILY